ncbi:MAG TPA: hypothetical protein VI953_00180 [Candidatus Paceibacterota bacterium]
MKESLPSENEPELLNYVEAQALVKEINDPLLKLHPEGYFEIGGLVIQPQRFIEVEGKDVPVKDFLTSVLDAQESAQAA